MITLGLTGSRYSGKSRVAAMFDAIQVPVFEADTIIKFMLNYNYELLGEIKSSLGTKIFSNTKDNELALNFSKLTKEDFDQILAFVEVELFQAYNKFNKRISKKTGAIYSVFHSSLIFEKKWENKFDMVANVFAPETDRIKRYRHLSNVGIITIKELCKTEFDPLLKNKFSDFVIKNPNEDFSPAIIPGRVPSNTVLKQVNEIDKKIIDEFIYKENLQFLM